MCQSVVGFLHHEKPAWAGHSDYDSWALLWRARGLGPERGEPSVKTVSASVCESQTLATILTDATIPSPPEGSAS
jgi:hypothetical protein